MLSEFLFHNSLHMMRICNFAIIIPFYGYSNANNITNFSPKIIPVFLGFATMANTYNTADISYLKKYEPIGCRDQYTMNAVRNSG